MEIDGEKYLGLYSIDEFFGRATIGQIEGISERCARWLDVQQAHVEAELARRAEEIEDLSQDLSASEEEVVTLEYSLDALQVEISDLQEALRTQFHDHPNIRNLIPDVAEAFDALESRL